MVIQKQFFRIMMKSMIHENYDSTYTLHAITVICCLSTLTYKLFLLGRMLRSFSFKMSLKKAKFGINIDWDKMFSKLVTQPTERLYEAIGWVLPEIGKEVQTDLFELLGF